MVGKPNFSSSGPARGAAMVTPGLNPLDEEREASMADEGGASGAEMESQDESGIPPLFRDLNANRSIETAYLETKTEKKTITRGDKEPLLPAEFPAELRSPAIPALLGAAATAVVAGALAIVYSFSSSRVLRSRRRHGLIHRFKRSF